MKRLLLILIGAIVFGTSVYLLVNLTPYSGGIKASLVVLIFVLILIILKFLDPVIYKYEDGHEDREK